MEHQAQIMGFFAVDDLVGGRGCSVELFSCKGTKKAEVSKVHPNSTNVHADHGRNL